MYFPLFKLHGWGKRSGIQPKTIYSELPLFRQERKQRSRLGEALNCVLPHAKPPSPRPLPARTWGVQEDPCAAEWVRRTNWQAPLNDCPDGSRQGEGLAPALLNEGMRLPQPLPRAS